ncbi:MAG: cytochrome C oxidase subunit IV family protein [Labilithrix sp.]|nr:cytochrome C oxidase subunit IV family protein [Labilithrix sp.]
MAPFSRRAIVITAVVLLSLWGASYALSAFSLGRAAMPVALVIALVKAALVVAIFMELARESVSMKMSVAAAASLLVLLIAFMVADVATRGHP